MSDDSFIREVDEELRSDRMKSIWKRFGKYIIALAVLIVLGTAADRGYDYWQENQASKSGDTFLAALNLAREGRQDEALEALRGLENDGYGAYAALARMRAATVLADSGDHQGAISDFSTIGNDRGIPTAIRDIARVRAAYLLVDHGSYEDVSAQVEVLTGADNPMRHSAREALGLAAWNQGDLIQAKQWFQQIADDTGVPAGITQRAQLMLDVITASGLGGGQS
ncbi:tetratricopeptide repeat protein [Hoeflea prorocentri]|uniref:Ancillary SecYEG translocon subunit n=1 Tax=Hoeflea prorocentri TaxID=1922333 RepID=A0A9X3UJ08_9HYPH|nr:tetratricopeptide repeat protein [Hoeflea prorocentri]MCY6381728.1 tetratricopeptide repeat protein [Hoeflea prorocentri]MDA5399528.1 tetratricopeptide repeat protein [Hoeflea prorocentri]